MSERYQAVIIGTGFGGAILSCRLAKKWRSEVLVLERGKRYPMGSFPRSPHGFAHNFWQVPSENLSHPRWLRRSRKELRGLFDLRSYRGMDVLMAAGLGGGSLIYANVFLLPPPEVFDDERWPTSCGRDELEPYYRIAKDVLGSRPLPQNGDPRRQVTRSDLFGDVAEKMGRPSRLVDINVFFGRDSKKEPIPIGEQQENRYGALQTSCLYCSECMIGCNYHSKNTLDLNYLHVAENRYQAEIRTEHLVERIVPVNDRDEEDPAANGSAGYRVHCRDLGRGENRSFLTKRVVLSAGSLGSTELLLRAKQHHRTLPQISDQLGKNFSGNGDFLSFVFRGKNKVDPNYGPVITRAIDFNLYENFDRDRAFLIEDASYPTLIAWFVEGMRPTLLRAAPLVRTLRRVLGRVFSGKSTGRAGYAASEILSDDLSYNTSVLLQMGLDKSDGTMFLGRHQRLRISWPYWNSHRLYRAVLKAGRSFRRAVRGPSRLWGFAERVNLRPIFLPLLTWKWPLRQNVTVHPLGGCVLADEPSKGVTSADPDHFGEVFGYRNLYVADGSIVPTAVGANPTATISALSEMVAEAITGVEPDAEL